ncbi:GNAT family N-acetyltransferase [Bradyrhizobium neotropicale]|uniref:Acetyltransferase n=1 Tax=Bradyrhizobium neotropicale TaxID=1497615 RepID=A0A176ZD81_9BRAD|nr:GNAT family N-acetyltransferase [Bradyrhizobium neotropicale]OAF18377.1 acetyltransferase [Bradyrhizobium neotropicale]
MMRIRPVRDADLDALYAISLATGSAGADAGHLYQDDRLLGHIYSAPYARLAPDLALVVEDEAGVAGFAVGAIDTEDWEARLDREWWSDLRRRYPDPTGAPGDWTADQRRCAMIHHPERTPTNIAQDYPAHIHLNLLPRLQQQGLGTRLLQAWLELAHERCARAVHVGVNRANARALEFWARQSFQPLQANGGAARTAWLGRLTVG